MTKTGIVLARTPKGWTAPCGCVFHIFDGLPDLEQIFDKEGTTLMRGVVAPHWHPCAKHGGKE